MSAPTVAEEQRAAVMLASLHASGYVDIEEHNGLRVGARIRHRGHQWSGAYLNGTGVVLHLTERNPSSWSQSWGAADIELIALWDVPGLNDTRLSQVAQYHVLVIAPAGEL